jgi:hypothetical protein
MTARPLPLADRDTRLDPGCTRLFGCPELHAIHFQPVGDRGGPCAAVSIQVPECSRQVVRRALAIAARRRARVLFLCDTHEQAQRMHALASRALRDHRFVSIERADAGAWECSS